MYCVETKNLTYKFSKQDEVLSNINLQVNEGSIYGFLGPNGAGKTTTLRLILGLLRKQEGEIEIFNKRFEKNRVSILKQIGSLIESPSLYGHLTAAENLKILQKIYQCPQSRINEVLEIVGLKDTGNKKTSKFSLGMKQRLSIAIAMLHSPLLLILDEPTNGLDPSGIIEIRELLIKLNEEQKTTIIVSSHLLSEIERVVTHIGIINKGQLLFQGTLKELKQKQTLGSVIQFETNDINKTMNIISLSGFAPFNMNGRTTINVVEKEIVAELAKQLVNNGVEIYQITSIKNDLESIFMDLINN